MVDLIIEFDRFEVKRHNIVLARPVDVLSLKLDFLVESYDPLSLLFLQIFLAGVDEVCQEEDYAQQDDADDRERNRC